MFEVLRQHLSAPQTGFEYARQYFHLISYRSIHILEYLLSSNSTWDDDKYLYRYFIPQDTLTFLALLQLAS